MNTYRTRLWHRFFLAAMLGLVLLGGYRLATLLPERTTRNDFAHYYASSRMLIEGQHPYGVPLDESFQRFGFDDPDQVVAMATNPPPLLWLFAPCALLSPQNAYWTWVLVQAVVLIALLWLTRHLLGEPPSPRIWSAVVALVLVSPAVRLHFYFAQVQLILALLLLAALACQLKRKPLAACALVSLAGLLKLFPLVLLPWFVLRGSQRLGKRMQCCAVSTLILLAGVLLTGPTLWIGFFTDARPVLVEWAEIGMPNYTIPAFTLNAGRVLALTVRSALLAQVAWPAGVLLGLGLIGWSYAICLRSPGACRVEFSCLCLGMLAGGATGWAHYHVILIFPFALMVAQVAARPTKRDCLLVVLAICMFALHNNDFRTMIADPRVAIWFCFCPLYALLVMLAYFRGRLPATGPAGLPRAGRTESWIASEAAGLPVARRTARQADSLLSG